MSRIDLLLFELDYGYDHDGWYPPLAKAIAGVTAAQASWRPQGEAANTIWETVNHLIYYKEKLLERLQGGTPVYSAADNTATFAVEAPDNEEAWQAAVARMEAIHRGLREFLASKSDADMDQLIGKTPTGFALANILMHDAYHVGQIVQVRKLQGTWPAHVSYQ